MTPGERGTRANQAQDVDVGNPPSVTADQRVKITMKLPFEIYQLGIDIGDADGHVCTAENPDIAKQLVAILNAHSALERGAGWQPVETAAKELARIAGSRNSADHWSHLRPLGGRYTSIEDYVERRWSEHVWTAERVVASLGARPPVSLSEAEIQAIAGLDRWQKHGGTGPFLADVKITLAVIERLTKAQPVIADQREVKP